jgi:hypothetical protein
MAAAIGKILLPADRIAARVRQLGRRLGRPGRTPPGPGVRHPARAYAPDWVGFDIPDRFVVGYGLDYCGRYRNLPYVAVLRQV